MPRVLILCEYASLNGGERSLLAVLDGVRAAGFEPQVGAPAEGPLARALAERGIPLAPLALHDPSLSPRAPTEREGAAPTEPRGNPGSAGAALSPPGPVSSAPDVPWTAQDPIGPRRPLGECRDQIGAIIGARRPDLVHANSLSMSRMAGPVTAGLGVPSLGHLRDMVRINATICRDLGQHARLLAVSAATRDWYVAAGLPPARLHVLFNGVDLHAYRPRPATGVLHRELHLPGDALLIGTIGQIGIRKGLLGLARAAGRVVAAVPAAHFLIVGKRYAEKPEAVAYAAKLSALAAQAPLQGHMHFLGIRDDVARLLPELAILAHAARQEPLGRVLLEAAAAGTPVVATAVGGTPEIFPPAAAAAVLVPPDDPESLAAALVALLHDPARRQQLGQRARQRAEHAFDARQASAALAAHYRAVLERPR